MDAKTSEGIFEKYLRDAKIPFIPDFIAYGKKNLDFCVGDTSKVLCDVKEVRASSRCTNGKIDAHGHIRNDIKLLRKKLGKNTLKLPSILVSMNFSGTFFTGLSVQRALLGDISVDFEGKTKSEAHHSIRGNAQFTKGSNTSVSGVLVFDATCSNHHFFENPFAAYPLAESYFPKVKFVKMNRSASGAELKSLSKIMFWPIEIDDIQPLYTTSTEC